METKRRPLHFVHLDFFDKSADRLLTDEELRLLQHTLNEDPEAGVVVQGTGGVRKLRIAGSGRGKRGGGRLLYLYVELRERVYLIAVLAKNEQPDFSAADYRRIQMLVQHLKKEQ